jgi:hypothetical protein
MLDQTTKTMSAGKGDKPRPVDGQKFRSNYDDIFRKNEQANPIHSNAVRSEPRVQRLKATRRDRKAD